MVLSATTSNGVFFEAAPAGCRFARVENARVGSGNRVYKESGDGGDTGKALEEIERDTFGGEDRASLAADVQQRAARWNMVAIRALFDHIDFVREKPKRFHGEAQTSDHDRFAGGDDGGGLSVGGDSGQCGRVAGADIILLDNMSLDDLRGAVKLVQGRSKLEASGGVNLNTVRSIAETGVDFISVGALTHSARAVDIGLDFK